MPAPIPNEQTHRPRKGKKHRGFGLALLMVFLASSVLLATSMALVVSPTLASFIKQTSLDAASAKALAEQALTLAQADMLTKMNAGTTITTAYRYPASGTSNIVMPTYPGSGATSTKGSYYVTATYARGFTYLLTAVVTVGNTQAVVPRLVQISATPSPYLNAYGIYSLRKVYAAYTGKAVQVRCNSGTVDIGFTSSGDFDVAAFRSQCTGDSQYPLDALIGAKAAYSLRKLKSGYTGYAIKVRRSSGIPSTQDIGFDSNGNLDYAGLIAFVGTGSGYIDTWYDQSGSGYDLNQSNSNNQPRIMNNGTFDSMNGVASVYFDGNDSIANNAVSGGIGGNQLRSFMVVGFQSGTNTYGHFATLFKTGDSDCYQTSTSAELLAMGGTTSRVYYTTNNYSAEANTLSANTPYQFTTYHDASDNMRLYKNGSLGIATNQASSLSTNTIILGDGAGDDTGATVQGYISELIIYTSNLTAPNQTLMETNQGHYFNIPGLQDGFVTTWYDQSGNGRNITQATNSLQPIINLSPKSPGIFFDGSTDYMDLASQNLTTDKLTLLAVGQISSDSAPSNGRAISVAKTGDGNDWGTATASALLLKLGNNLGNSRTGDLTIATNIIYGRDFQATILFDGTNRTVRAKQNGTLAPATTTTGGSGNLVINKLRVGQSATGTAGHEYWKGNIYEFVFFPTNISVTTYQTIETDQQTYYSIN